MWRPLISMDGGQHSAGSPRSSRMGGRSQHASVVFLRRVGKLLQASEGRLGTIRPIGELGVSAADGANCGHPDRNCGRWTGGGSNPSSQEFDEAARPRSRDGGDGAWIHFFSEGFEVVNVPQSDTHGQAAAAPVVEGDRFSCHFLDTSSPEVG